MVAAGYDVDGPGLRGPAGWQGSLPDVEARLKTLTRQRAEAEAALAVLLRSDEEQAAQEAEAQGHRAALRTMRLKGSGASLRALTLDAIRWTWPT